jgi:hypothetical protein
MKVLCFCLAVLFSGAGQSLEAAVLRSGFNSNSLSANDDGSTGLVNFGFDVNYFGTTYGGGFLNNNGNITFTGPLSTFTPFQLTAGSTPMIAAFFADVDTRGPGSDLLRYGSGSVGGRAAFGVTWDGVGYYSSGVDKLNEFQIILVDRSDTGVGNFDIEFNYDKIKWETGEASGGSAGLGGSSARAGYSNGAGNFLELVGSGVNGAFLDGGPNSLASGQIGASVDRGALAGQYVFQARNGSVVDGQVPEPATLLVWATLGLVSLMYRKRMQKINCFV